MPTRPALELHAQQRLCLTPQLRQALHVLRCSMPELERELARALAENPWLEPSDTPVVEAACLPPEARALRDDTAGAMGVAVGAMDDISGALREAASAAADTSDADEAAGSLADAADSWEAEPATDEASSAAVDWNAPEAQAPGANLRDHLLNQLRLMRAPDRERALVMLLIDELDDNGYLAASLEEIAASMPEGLQAAPAEWAAALARLQTLEPAGVGARTLSECLLLQIAGLEDAPAEVRVCASLLAGEYLAELASNRPDRLARKLGCAPALLEQAHRLLLRLDPKPGRAWSIDATHWVVPEILVRRQGTRWEAYLNPEALPRVRLRRDPGMLAAASASASASASAAAEAEASAKGAGVAGAWAQTQALAAADDTQTHAQEQWRQAQGLLRQLRQRYDTLLRVARQVVACQQDYFHHGPRAMRPLVLREVARTLGLHESTVSRATRHKYAQTSWGVSELRYFFAPAVASAMTPDALPAVCATAVRAWIREWIACESATHPLSDNRLAQRLAKAGMPVARRTVAKYREAEGIPNAFRRRGGRSEVSPP